MAWTGSNYLLGWYEGAATDRGFSYSNTLRQLHAASFDRLGGPLSNARLIGESPEPDPISIALAYGATTLAYARLGDDQHFGGVPRAFLDTPVAERRRPSRK